MDHGLESFIAARRDEGNKYVIIDVDAGCIGWGITIDEAWENARWYYPTQRVADSQCYGVTPGEPPIEGFDEYKARRSGAGDDK